MIYNVALVFESNISRDVFNFYNKIKTGMNFEFGLEKRSISHCTIIKFDAPGLGVDELKDIIRGIKSTIEVDFSGITLLPSRSSPGCWVEIPILKSKALIGLQDELLKRLGDYEILSGIRDRFRPHVTLAKTKDCEFDIENLNSSLLRKARVKAKLAIGISGIDFEFHNLD